MEHYDVIIIGSGAGGGTLAHRLAPSGKRTLLLERGDWLAREPQNWLAQDVFVDGRYISKDSWLDAGGKPFQPQVHYFVGGATKLYGAALYRLRAEDFGELRHHDGISPAWPIPYETMEPYYSQAEELYRVHGARGEDPTEPPAGGPYPYPAVSHEPRIEQLSEDLAASGHHPFHAPCGVMLDESNMPYSACVRCPDCDGFPCLVHAKSDAEVIAVRPALAAHENLTLLRNTRALRLQTDDAGTSVTEVLVERDGEQERFGADIVVVSAGAANSAALLLASASERHPRGLANGSDVVGRNYMFHNSVAVLALSHEPNPTIFQKTLGVNDYYFSGPDFEFPLGNIQMVGKSQAPMFRGEKPYETLLAPKWTLEDIARHAVDFWLSTEDLPVSRNRVTLSGDGQIQLTYDATNAEPRKRLYHTLTSLFSKLGMQDRHLLRHAYLQNPIPVAGVAHQAGTCRFGSDPASSVLDVDCKAHELDNLYVVDTSFFPSIGAVNPALTAMANALRVGDHLLERLGTTVAARGGSNGRGG
ncbi:MAG TPA: GMC family oxidoreductase [Gemmatimonadales bacterium]|nr:GMC family oxidoreductase [Gemmatimonadales bacterium]